jgi:hypothetical protein
LPNSPSYEPKLFAHLSKLFHWSISEYKCQDKGQSAGENNTRIEDIPPTFMTRLGVCEEGYASNKLQAKDKVNVD